MIIKDFCNIKTPAFILNEAALVDNARRLVEHVEEYDFVKVLYSLKPLSLNRALKLLNNYVHGFSCSSYNEARWARENSSEMGIIHYVSPIIKSDVIKSISPLCNYITFNSPGQLGALKDQVKKGTQVGIRINPQLSFIDDDRYNPSRKHSKLGTPIRLFEKNVIENKLLESVNGIHFHNNCESTDISQLTSTIDRIVENLGKYLPNIKWMNLGGGYSFNGAENINMFLSAVTSLNRKYGLNVMIEPGASLVRNAGTVVSSVTDIFESDGKNLAILDTTTNHMPEVFEYQYEPDVDGHRDGASHSYILAGCSCLAGDLFGEYSFDEPLKIGSRIVFKNMGAYTLVKANMFNGINLPTIYTYSEDENLTLIKEYTYNDFLMLSGDNSNVSS